VNEVFPLLPILLTSSSVQMFVTNIKWKNWRGACKNLVTTSFVVLRKSTFSVKISGRYRVYLWRHTMCVMTYCTYRVLPLTDILNAAIHFETNFISRDRRKIRQDTAMIFASIDRGHSNISNLSLRYLNFNKIGAYWILACTPSILTRNGLLILPIFVPIWSLPLIWWLHRFPPI
jgi:hypothetical protein